MSNDNDTVPLTPAPAEQPARPSRGRAIALGVIAGVAAAAVASGGIALASSLGSPAPIAITSSPIGGPSGSPSPAPSQSSDDVLPGDADYASVTAAALAAVGGGTVTEVDRGDATEDWAWKVEIRLANGDEAEVRLAADLSVIRVELDNDDDGGHGSDDRGSDDRGGHGDDD